MADVFYVYKTGRSRTLTLEATGSIPRFSANRLGIPPDPGIPGDPGTPAYIKQKSGRVVITAPGSNPISRGQMTAGTSDSSRAIGWYATADTGFGDADSQDNVTSVSVSLGGSATNNATYVATWSAEVEEWAILYFITDGVAGADGDPLWGGRSVGDVNPRAFGVRYFEAIPDGGTVTASMVVTASLASASATATSTVSGTTLLPDYYGQTWVQAEAFDNETGSTQSSTVTAAFAQDWVDMGPISPVSDSTTYSSVSISGNSISVSVTSDPGAGGSITLANGYSDGEPPRRYTTKAQTYALGNTYPDALTLNLSGVPSRFTNPLPVTGSATQDWDQRNWSGAWEDTTGSSHSLGSTLDDVAPIRGSWGGLSAVGEDPTDWVAMIAGKAYNGLKIKHVAETTQPAPTFISSGVYGHTYSGSPGNYEGYAWLKATLSTGAIGTTITLTLAGDPSKTYTALTTSTGSHAVYFDLTKPATPSPTDDPELWDSRYPIRNDGLPHEDPVGWGVGRCASYQLSGTGMTATAVSLARRGGAAILDAAPAFLDWELVQTTESYQADGTTGTPPIIQGTRGLVLTVDGRRSIIEPISARQLFIDGLGVPFWVYSGRTARQFKATANAVPGVTSDETLYSATDGWHALDGTEGVNLIDGGDIYYAGWSGFILGGGVTWNGATPTNQLGFSLPTDDSAISIPMQPRYHEVLGYPGMGDPWTNGGAYNTRTLIRVARILRASVDGIAHGVAAGTSIVLRDSMGGMASSGVTDSYGRFRLTSNPLGKGQHDHDVTLGGSTASFVGSWDDTQSLGTVDATQERFNARRWHRIVFRGSGTSASLPYNFHTEDGQYHRVSIQDGDVIYNRADSFVPLPSWAVATTVTSVGDVTWAHVGIDKTTRRLEIVYTRGSTGYVVYSTDHGVTWTTPTTL